VFSGQAKLLDIFAGFSEIFEGGNVIESLGNMIESLGNRIWTLSNCEREHSSLFFSTEFAFGKVEKWIESLFIKAQEQAEQC